MIANVIDTEKLTKSYGSHRGIIEVDLAAEQGEIFVSREPSLEETFLAQYGREAAEVK